jgi:hypothetical protein
MGHHHSDFAEQVFYQAINGSERIDKPTAMREWKASAFAVTSWPQYLFQGWGLEQQGGM